MVNISFSLSNSPLGKTRESFVILVIIDICKIKKRITVRSSKLLLLLRALIIAVIVFCGYKILTSPQWYYPQGMFNSVTNKNFNIVGTYITPKEKILQVMKKVSIPKIPLYMLDVKAYEDRISEIETVKSVFSSAGEVVSDMG